MAETLGSSTGGGRGMDACARGPGWRELGLHRLIKIAIVGGLFCFVFRNELESLFSLWLDPTWSHGFIIPLFSLYFLNQRRREILALEYVQDPLAERLAGRRPGRLQPNQTRPDYLGLALLLGILAFYVFNVVSPAGYAYFRSLSVIAALGAVVLFLGGRRLVRHTWFPIAFLVFAIPWPGRSYRDLTWPLQRVAASVAAVLLNLLHGVEATASGVIINIVYKGQRLEPRLEVADECSGMRLLMAFVAMGVAMAFLHYRPVWQRLILLLSTVPIAVLCNIVRVTTTGFIYVMADPKYTRGIYHDMLGLAMLPLAFATYGLLATFMSHLFVNEEEGDVIVRRQTAR